MRKLTSEEEEKAAKLFAPAPDPREGKTRLTVRFDVGRFELLAPPEFGKRPYRKPFRNGTVIRFVEEPARTPTGGRYIRRALTVRTKDGRKWYGTMKKDSDIVRLRLAPTDHETD